MNNSKSSGGKGGKAANGGSGGQSKYAMTKEGWGDQHNFMHSYGLKPTPDGYEEANRIADAFMEADRANSSAHSKK